MAIKMRNNKDMNSVCDGCGEKRKNTLEMFDLCIGTTIVTICDVCNEQILIKTLKGECNKNARVKTPEDRRVLMRRAQNSYSAKLTFERFERERLEAEKLYNKKEKTK